MSHKTEKALRKMRETLFKLHKEGKLEGIMKRAAKEADRASALYMQEMDEKMAIEHERHKNNLYK